MFTTLSHNAKLIEQRALGSDALRNRHTLVAQRMASATRLITSDELIVIGIKEHNTKRNAFALQGDEREGLAVTVYSFGFKHGAALDADIVIDVRFLPNPYYDPALKSLTGLDAPVRDFVMYRDETVEFMSHWKSLLDCVMPGYVKEGKRQLAIAVGCTGGQHRSVAIAEATGDYLRTRGYRVSVTHRDLPLAESVQNELTGEAKVHA